MKSRSSLKHLGLAMLTTLSLAAGGAQAGNPACLPGHQAPIPQTGITAAGTAQFQERMRWIEQALQVGRISPYDAGRLMRQQWELARFQQGFLAGGQTVPAGAPQSGCLSADLAARIAPLGDMAVGGMQSASSLMRTLMREAERLISEQLAPDRSPL